MLRNVRTLVLPAIITGQWRWRLTLRLPMEQEFSFTLIDAVLFPGKR